MVPENHGLQPARRENKKIASSMMLNVLFILKVLIMGGIHGDERLGPNIVTYLAEYLIDRNQNDVEITNLIKNRMIILYPMSNPSGYYYNQRVILCIWILNSNLGRENC